MSSRSRGSPTPAADLADAVNHDRILVRDSRTAMRGATPSTNQKYNSRGRFRGSFQT